jgi:multiple sugar transport system permease protein
MITTTRKVAPTTAPGTTRRRHGRRRRRDAICAAVLLAPALGILFVMRVVPMFTAIEESLQHTSIMTGTTRFIGLANYTYLFTSRNFYSVLLVTLVFNLVLNPVIVVLSTALALLYTQRIPLAGLWRSLVFVPAAVPGSVVALIWSTALQPDGLVNGALRLVGLPAQPFYTSSSEAAFSIGLLVTWGAVGYWMIFIVAGINDIPGSLYEAATLDGAGWWRRLFSITLPLLRRPMSFVLVACTVGSFLIFAPVQILTHGGPEGSTNFIMYDIYNRSYLLSDLGVGQAEVVVLMVILAIIVALQFRILRRD